MVDDTSDGAAPIASLLHPSADRRLRELPSLARRSMALVWVAARREFVITAMLQGVSGVALAVQLLVGRALLKYLLTLHAGQGLRGAIPDVLVLSLAVAFISLANVVRFEFQQLLGELVSRHALEQVLAVASRVDLLAFESPAYHDRLQRAQFNATARPLQMTNGVLSLTGSMFGCLAVGAALLTIAPLLALLAVVAVLPVWAMTLRAGQALYRFGFEQTERDRRRTYLQLLLTQRDAAKEVRGYGLAGHLRARYHELYGQRIDDLRLLIRRRTRQGAFGSLATSLLSGGTVGLLVWLVASHRLSLAAAGAAAGGLLLLGNQLQGLVSGAGALYESALFIQDFTSFLEIDTERPPEHLETDPSEIIDDFMVLSAENVSFRYPSREVPALDQVSVRLERGQVVAVVGENGSGKSTLAKVLSGLYVPSDGTVRWDATDVRQIGTERVCARTAVLFQDFVHYQMTAADNITMGRWRNASDLEAARAAAQRAGADDFLRDLPNGYDTQLGPEFFGGVDLSGGQWQRMALARAYFRDAALVILDEPTASLDPRSEAELFATVRDLFSGRTVLLISHRMASVRMADYIYVLAEGRLVEEGTHDGLMRACGLYAELFALQAAAYRD